MIVHGKRDAYGSCFHVFENTGLVVSFTAFPAFENVITGMTGVLPAGRYKVTPSYSWNHDSTNNSFVSRLLVNGALVAAFVPHIHRQEPSDANGAARFPATGTDQTFGFCKPYFVDLPAPQAMMVELDIATTNATLESSIWESSIEIIRVE